MLRARESSDRGVQHKKAKTSLPPLARIDDTGNVAAFIALGLSFQKSHLSSPAAGTPTFSSPRSTISSSSAIDDGFISLIGLFEAHDRRRVARNGATATGTGTGLASCTAARSPPRRLGGCDLIDGLAHRAHDRRPTEIVKPRPTAWQTRLVPLAGFDINAPRLHDGCCLPIATPDPCCQNLSKPPESPYSRPNEAEFDRFSAAGLKGRIRVPGDKSISHRALIFGALATGRTRITGLLEADDVLATAKAVAALGADIDGSRRRLCGSGRGVGGLDAQRSSRFRQFGNGKPAHARRCRRKRYDRGLTGDASLAPPAHGARAGAVEAHGPRNSKGIGRARHAAARCPRHARPLPIDYDLPVPSAQVKSAVLLAGLHAPGRTTVIEKLPTRDHTERMLRFFGAELNVEAGPGGALSVSILGDAELHGADLYCAGRSELCGICHRCCIDLPALDIVIEGVLMNPTRTGFIETLREMGANIEILDLREEGGEPVGDLRVKSSNLRGVTVPPERAPSMIDEYPVLAVVASFADGETHMQVWRS